jgi:hypothetical protein
VRRAGAKSQRGRGRPEEGDLVPRLIELLRKQPERDGILAEGNPEAAARVDPDAVGDVGVAERDDEPQAGAVIPGDALGGSISTTSPMQTKILCTFRAVQCSSGYFHTTTCESHASSRTKRSLVSSTRAAS